HFQWDKPPAKASERQVIEYLLDRALRSQGLVSLDSACHLSAWRKPLMRQAIDKRVKQGKLLSVAIDGAGKVEHWATPETLAGEQRNTSNVHILSPFDPLIIQRKRLKMFFGYDHLFE